MPIIDLTYFTEELVIAKLDTPAVESVINGLIAKREPELLKDVLGYGLYKDMLTGLQQDPIAHEWTDLLFGVEYTDRFGNLRRWEGIIQAPATSIGITSPANDLPVVIGADDVETQTIPVPTDLIDRVWTISKRALGPLRSDEYTVSDDGASVAVSFPIVLNDTYFFSSPYTTFDVEASDLKQSFIANFVYYWYLRSNASQTTAMGEGVSVSENTTTAGPAVKQGRAWNEMIDKIYQMWAYLQNNRTLYPSWDWRTPNRMRCDYSHISRF